jgi:type IV secretion system protein VirD4
MNAKNIKRLILPNIPYVFLWWLFDKAGEAYRTAYGMDTLKKIVGAAANLNVVLSHPAPSFDPFDVLVGLIGAAAICLTVLYKKTHAKKWRKDVEYGSARWGNRSDIAPYIDEKPSNNIILTATESLTMNSRPKIPKYARNKNVMIVGGSGSGKTRFWLKPNLMQLHRSYCVTDPKGTILIECG